MTFERIKAKIFLLLVAVIWGSMIWACWKIQVPLLLASFVTKSASLREWNYSLWMVQDQATCFLLSGHHETTVSSAIGELSKTSDTAEHMRRVVDWLFLAFAGQRDHCRRAIEEHDTHRFNIKYAAIGVTSYLYLFINHML